MVITVIGGGNIGTLMAGEFAARGHEVRMYTSDAPAWSGDIDVYGPEGDLPLMTGHLALVTDDLEKAVSGADWVWVTHPTSRFQPLSKRLVPLITAGQRLAVVPGADAEFYFGACVEKGAELLGLQRVHSIARLRERGRSVYMLGRKPSIQLASIPADAATRRAEEVSGLFDLPVEILPNYLVETLTPSNPILHTTRIASMFAGWHEGMTYPENILFYESWTLESSQLLIACDSELQTLCRTIEQASQLDLSEVRSLRVHYESPTAEAMTAKISGIPAFKGLTSPMKEIAPGQWVPDFSSRYFKADFAYGLKVIRDMAALFGVETPGIESVWQWYVKTSGDTEWFDKLPSSADALCEMYR